MKFKLFMLLMAAFLSVSVFASPQITEEKAKDLTERLSKISNKTQKSFIEAQITLGRMDSVESFQTIVDVCRTFQKKYNTPEKRMNYYISLLAYHWFDGKFKEEGYEFAKKDGNEFVIHFILNRDLPKITVQEKFNIVKTYLLERKCPKEKILSGVRFLQEKSIILNNNEETKEIFEKLNRIYTMNLGIDKAFWEPIVATVRLALSTY